MSHTAERTSFWSARRVMVTGGGGFFGSFVTERLRAEGAKDVFIPRSRDYDLIDPAAVRRAYRDGSPDMVIHLAAVVGGIGANQRHPGEFFYKNLRNFGKRIFYNYVEFRIELATAPGAWPRSTSGSSGGHSITTSISRAPERLCCS